jgi:RNA 2',3'-cyclic 3'-phosphodiesterase
VSETAPPRPLRLFVAVEPPDAVRDAVEAALAPWRDAIPGARWSARESWHVTLKFLGATPPDLVDRTADAVAEAAGQVTTFETRLTGLGAFPGRGRARVLWAGLDDRSGRLAGLALGVDAVLADIFPPERRPLHPHLTVGRCDPAVRLPERFVETPVASVAFAVDGVSLFRSHLGGGPPRYERLRRVPLAVV